MSKKVYCLWEHDYQPFLVGIFAEKPTVSQLIDKIATTLNQRYKCKQSRPLHEVAEELLCCEEASMISGCCDCHLTLEMRDLE